MHLPLKKIIPRIKGSLFTYNNEPFSKFSILIIIMLDIFLLFTILYGVDSETKMSPSLNVRYPHSCQNHFNPKYKNLYIGLSSDKTETYPFSSYRMFQSYTYRQKHIQNLSRNGIDRTAPICKKLDEKISVFVKSGEWKKNQKLKQELLIKKQGVTISVANIEKRYNTNLFEKTALDSSPELSKNKNKYYSLLEKKKLYTSQLKQIKPVSDYAGYAEYKAFVLSNKDAFKEEFEKYRFWQPFTSFLYLLKFILPLFLISLAGYVLSSRREEKIKSVPTSLLRLISGHIIFMVSVILFFNVLNLIYSIIPHRFLNNLIEFLYEFGVVFLGYYALLFLGILFFGLIIFFIQRSVSRRNQRKREEKEKTLYIDSYHNNLCPHCREKVDYSRNYCGNCGEALNVSCDSCNAKTPCGLRNCLECGSKLVKDVQTDTESDPLPEDNS